MEIIPKEAQKVPRWLDFLFYFSLGLLIFIFIAYFIINHSLKTSQKTLDDLESSLSKDVSEKSELKKEILTYQKKIKDFSVLLSVHLKASNIFVFMEEQCHPKVWFNNFNLDTKEGKVFLLGEAQDFESLGQQLIILRNEKLIKNVELASVSMKKEGKITFNLSLSFDPLIFK